MLFPRRTSSNSQGNNASSGGSMPVSQIRGRTDNTSAKYDEHGDDVDDGGSSNGKLVVDSVAGPSSNSRNSDSSVVNSGLLARDAMSSLLLIGLLASLTLKCNGMRSYVKFFCILFRESRLFPQFYPARHHKSYRRNVGQWRQVRLAY